MGVELISGGPSGSPRPTWPWTVRRPRTSAIGSDSAGTSVAARARSTSPTTWTRPAARLHDLGIVDAPPDDDALGTKVELPDVAGVCVQCDVDLTSRRLTRRAPPSRPSPGASRALRARRGPSPSRRLRRITPSPRSPRTPRSTRELVLARAAARPSGDRSWARRSSARSSRASLDTSARIGLADAADLGALDANRGRPLDPHEARARFDLSSASRAAVSCASRTVTRVTPRGAAILDARSGIHRGELERAGARAACPSTSASMTGRSSVWLTRAFASRRPMRSRSSSSFERTTFTSAPSTSRSGRRSRAEASISALPPTRAPIFGRRWRSGMRERTTAVTSRAAFHAGAR